MPRKMCIVPRGTATQSVLRMSGLVRSTAKSALSSFTVELRNIGSQRPRRAPGTRGIASLRGTLPARMPTGRMSVVVEDRERVALFENAIAAPLPAARAHNIVRIVLEPIHSRAGRHVLADRVVRSCFTHRNPRWRPAGDSGAEFLPRQAGRRPDADRHEPWHKNCTVTVPLPDLGGQPGKLHKSGHYTKPSRRSSTEARNASFRT